jgi:hypothetical protein
MWTAIWGWVLRLSAAANLRRLLLYLTSALVIVIFGVSIYFLPYAFIRAAVLGSPVTKVNVLAQQWAWTFSQDKFRTGVPVEFNVT